MLDTLKEGHTEPAGGGGARPHQGWQTLRGSCTKFSQLKQCENELVLLAAELWQYMDKVKIQLKVWEDTPGPRWISMQTLEMQCTLVYMRDMQVMMDKEMRSWDNFIWLQETIKNILVALRAIHQLRNPAIKDRHWTRLSSATQN
ncbi:dynein heavy chain 17, axonemal [Caerostris extrusa]|uniref:Dynein heavy chain 17, axonemal n=1 Tax=Caerostris extrusa TaxID=172846 RepID=A0AAV4V751_CAEEX|nr:dynein heavy chain 17, axonemal [Caerostris extrusa]